MTADATLNPVERLQALRLLTNATVTAVECCVDQARADRSSWTEIGAILGISKQGAAKRYSRPTPAAPDAPDTPNDTADDGPTAAAEPLEKKTKSPGRGRSWEVTLPSGRVLLRANLVR